jgi:hypothetical protein
MLLTERPISPNPYPLPAAFWGSAICKDAFTTSRTIYPGRIYEQRWSPLAPPIEGAVIVPIASIQPGATATAIGAKQHGDQHAEAEGAGDAGEEALAEPRSGGKSRQARLYWKPLVAAIERLMQLDPDFPEKTFEQQRELVMKEPRDWKKLKLPGDQKMLRLAFKEAIVAARAKGMTREASGRRG